MGSLSAGAAELARGKTVTASSLQIGNEPAKGNDNDTTTRWCAVSATFPQWWRVDLGAVHRLTQVSIQFEHPERTYSYVIEASQNDALYTQEATLNGTGAVQTVDLPPNLSARYLRITITGGTPGLDASGTTVSDLGVLLRAVVVWFLSAGGAARANRAAQPGYQITRGSSGARVYAHAASTIRFRSKVGRQPSRNFALVLSSQVEKYGVSTGTPGLPRVSAK
jgi:hypothetical protein